MRILLADDDPNILDPMEIALRQAGFAVLAARDGIHAWDVFTTERPDFAVLDVTMPGLDGLELTRRIARDETQRVPVILLTGRQDERDRVAGLDLGADDYVVKPVSNRELIARIRAVWRRTRGASPTLTAGNLMIDPGIRQFYIDGQAVAVTVTEFDLLLMLLERAGHVVPTQSIMERVWGYVVSDDLLHDHLPPAAQDRA